MNKHPMAAALASYGLRGSGLEMPSEPLEPESWRGLVADVRGQRVAGFLTRAISDGAFPATPQQQEEALQAHVESMSIAVMLERSLLETIGHLTSEGIDYRVLKGPALAHLVYPDPSLRSFGDVDVLVPAGQFDAAKDLLSGLGHERRYPEPRRGFDRRFSKGGAFITPDGLEIDLHRTFVAGPFGLTVDLDGLFASSSPFALGGETVLGLGPVEAFLHACFHAALGNRTPRLVPLRDVAQILLTADLDLEAVTRLSKRWKADGVVARGVSLAWAEFRMTEVTPLSTWAAGYRSGRREQRWLRAYTSEGRSWAGQSLVGLEAVPGVRAKAAYVRALVLPDPQYLRLRGDRSVVERWRRGLRTLRRRPPD